MKRWLSRVRCLIKRVREMRRQACIISKRVKLTTSIRDTDYIPKVDHAGEVVWERGCRCQVMHNGMKVKLGGYHGAWMAQIIKELRGHHEPQEEKAFYEVLRKVPSNAVMLECGCFWAYYSLWFRYGHPDRKNYLIEPIEHKMEVGKANFRLNGYSGDFMQGFVSSSYHPDMLYDDDEFGEQNIPRISIDWYMKKKPTEHY